MPVEISENVYFCAYFWVFLHVVLQSTLVIVLAVCFSLLRCIAVGTGPLCSFPLDAELLSEAL